MLIDLRCNTIMFVEVINYCASHPHLNVVHSYGVLQHLREADRHSPSLGGFAKWWDMTGVHLIFLCLSWILLFICTAFGPRTFGFVCFLPYFSLLSCCFYNIANKYGYTTKSSATKSPARKINPIK